MERPRRPSFRPQSRTPLLRNLISIRVCSLTFFTMALVLTTVSVVIVLVMYSTHSIMYLKDASTRTMVEISNRTSMIMGNLLQSSSAVLEEAAGFSSSSIITAYEASENQVMEMSARLLGNDLAQLVRNVLDYLGSVQNAMEATYRMLISIGADLNNLNHLLALAPFIFSSLHFERTYSVTLAGTQAGIFALFMDPSLLGYPPLAALTPGDGIPVNTYPVNASTYKIIYPGPGCFRSFLTYCNYSGTLSALPDVVFATTLSAGELKFGPLLTASGALPLKYVSISTAIRGPDNTMLGLIARNAGLLALAGFLQALVADEPSQRMYL
eukprot:RCo024164